jgi:hypothetical protein
VHYSKFTRSTSGVGQNQTSERFRAMSALPPKADIDGARWNVRYVPLAEQRKRPTSEALA